MYLVSSSKFSSVKVNELSFIQHLRIVFNSSYLIVPSPIGEGEREYVYCINTNTLSNLPSTSYTLNRNCSFSIGVPLSSKVSALIISLRLIEPLPSSSNISKKRRAKNEDYKEKNNLY